MRVGVHLGKHLIVSDIDVHKEQSPGNPYLFEKLNAEDMAAKIKTLWTSASDKQFPDTDQERKAFNAYKEQVKDFGRRFLKVASKLNGKA